MTAVMKTASTVCAKSHICTLISQLLKAAPKPCAKEKKIAKEEQQKDKPEEEQKRPIFLLISISSALDARGHH